MWQLQAVEHWELYIEADAIVSDGCWSGRAPVPHLLRVAAVWWPSTEGGWSRLRKQCDWLGVVLRAIVRDSSVYIYLNVLINDKKKGVIHTPSPTYIISLTSIGMYLHSWMVSLGCGTWPPIRTRTQLKGGGDCCSHIAKETIMRIPTPHGPIPLWQLCFNKQLTSAHCQLATELQLPKPHHCGYGKGAPMVHISSTLGLIWYPSDMTNLWLGRTCHMLSR